MPEIHEQIEQTRVVPRGALFFGYGPCQFGSAGDDGTIPVSLVARSAEPINHWYWGAVVHDLAGMDRHKDHITLDYAHYDSEVLGYADQFEVTPAGLNVSGRLTPFGAQDRASEVAHKSAMGVPYESSIFFAYPVIEEVPAGKTTQVNGKQFSGPITVVRRCDLRGIAICPYGADKNTPVKFAADENVSVKIIQPKENIMAEHTPAEEVKEETNEPEAKPVVEEIPVEVPSATPEPAAVQQAAKTGKDFLEAFGEQGAVWFVNGKTWEEAQKLYTDGLKSEIETLKTRLQGSEFGQEKPVSFAPADDDLNEKCQATLAAKVGNKMARIVASLKK